CIIDETHCGRHVTGIERITLELFSAAALSPLRVLPLRSGNSKRMVLDQLVTLPRLARQHRDALVLCSGFPPTPPLTLSAGARVIPYIHDLFLLTRPQELNWRARAYMAPSLRLALRRLKRFMVNSQCTDSELRRFVRADADIRLYRPAVRNVLGLDENRPATPRDKHSLKLLALGTIEPRKNLAAAASIVAALRTRGIAATLDIIGREGWGGEADKLKARTGVMLHGYAPMEKIRALAAEADFFISTSHAEGLGLPLLEIQYAGLPVIAPDQPVFREVLGDSGLLIDPADAGSAAQAIIAATRGDQWRAEAAQAARANLRRWNAQAQADQAAIIRWLSGLAAKK
ncbi:MAG: glycosyltransferase, partial [Beijerinckiaceae bacterium]